MENNDFTYDFPLQVCQEVEGKPRRKGSIINIMKNVMWKE